MTDGPGTIEEFLKAEAIPYKVVNLAQGEKIAHAEAFSVLVLLGGAMSVHEEKQYPYFLQEMELIKEFTREKKRVLGICLGAQLIAKAYGASVFPGSEEEIGWYNLELTEEGVKDFFLRSFARHPFSKKFQKELKVFQWHRETFELPEKAIKLAGSFLYPNQAFKIEPETYAFQFHLEVTKEMIIDWIHNEKKEAPQLKSDTEKHSELYAQQAWNFYELFFKAG